MEIVFTFHSTHGAIGGEKALLDGGIPVRVMALPSSLGAGCGLCLRVAEGDLDQARRLMAEAGVEPEGVYRKSLEEGKTVYSAICAAPGK